jgi:DNA processing protein
MAKAIEITNKRYPKLLKQIPGAPSKLYYKGKWDQEIFKNCLAVVGSRRMTRYGKDCTRAMVTAAVEAGLTIVSGFMYGIDAAAHQAAVDAKGRTIAAMPCGIDLIHPAYQDKLYQEILDNNGLILSEYPAKTEPQNWTYPQRNRIVAGLSQATLVVEAALKSGSLITARLARQYKRRLFAMPGPVNNVTSQGTLKLINDGAQMAVCPQDILTFYGIDTAAISKKQRDAVSPLEKKIITALVFGPMEIDELILRVKLPINELSATLSLLELNGFIKEYSGKYHLNAEVLDHAG